ncbi:hypothetical protein [Trinickia dabaoshanensis]|uniref:hypothetical protein n=1 Tax=Trinickia dabaoshanensis TaxID=564714 RepID=UPI0011AEC61D|nr:hypothetical protein [Trinickia dabaoshanensis]
MTRTTSIGKKLALADEIYKPGTAMRLVGAGAAAINAVSMLHQYDELKKLGDQASGYQWAQFLTSAGSMGVGIAVAKLRPEKPPQGSGTEVTSAPVTGGNAAGSRTGQGGDSAGNEVPTPNGAAAAATTVANAAFTSDGSGKSATTTGATGTTGTAPSQGVTNNTNLDGAATDPAAGEPQTAALNFATTNPGSALQNINGDSTVIADGPEEGDSAAGKIVMPPLSTASNPVPPSGGTSGSGANTAVPATGTSGGTGASGGGAGNQGGQTGGSGTQQTGAGQGPASGTGTPASGVAGPNSNSQQQAGAAQAGGPQTSAGTASGTGQSTVGGAAQGNGTGGGQNQSDPNDPSSIPNGFDGTGPNSRAVTFAAFSGQGEAPTVPSGKTTATGTPVGGSADAPETQAASPSTAGTNPMPAGSTSGSAEGAAPAGEGNVSAAPGNESAASASPNQATGGRPLSASKSGPQSANVGGAEPGSAGQGSEVNGGNTNQPAAPAQVTTAGAQPRVQSHGGNGGTEPVTGRQSADGSGGQTEQGEPSVPAAAAAHAAPGGVTGTPRPAQAKGAAGATTADSGKLAGEGANEQHGSAASGNAEANKAGESAPAVLPERGGQNMASGADRGNGLPSSGQTTGSHPAAPAVSTASRGAGAGTDETAPSQQRQGVISGAGQNPQKPSSGQPQRVTGGAEQGEGRRSSNGDGGKAQVGQSSAAATAVPGGGTGVPQPAAHQDLSRFVTKNPGEVDIRSPGQQHRASASSNSDPNKAAQSSPAPQRQSGLGTTQRGQSQSSSGQHRGSDPAAQTQATPTGIPIGSPATAARQGSAPGAGQDPQKQGSGEPQRATGGPDQGQEERRSRGGAGNTEQGKSATAAKPNAVPGSGTGANHGVPAQGPVSFLTADPGKLPNLGGASPQQPATASGNPDANAASSSSLQGHSQSAPAATTTSEHGNGQNAGGQNANGQNAEGGNGRKNRGGKNRRAKVAPAAAAASGSSSESNQAVSPVSAATAPAKPDPATLSTTAASRQRIVSIEWLKNYASSSRKHVVYVSGFYRRGYAQPDAAAADVLAKLTDIVNQHGAQNVLVVSRANDGIGSMVYDAAHSLGVETAGLVPDQVRGSITAKSNYVVRVSGDAAPAHISDIADQALYFGGDDNAVQEVQALGAKHVPVRTDTSYEPDPVLAGDRARRTPGFDPTPLRTYETQQAIAKAEAEEAAAVQASLDGLLGRVLKASASSPDDVHALMRQSSKAPSRKARVAGISPKRYLRNLYKLSQYRPDGAEATVLRPSGERQPFFSSLDAKLSKDPSLGTADYRLSRRTAVSPTPRAIGHRIFVNPRPEHVLDVAKHLVGVVDSNPLDHPGVADLTVAGPTSLAARTDRLSVSVVTPEDRDRVIDALHEYQQAHPDHFDDVQPPMAAPHMRGVSSIEEPTDEQIAKAQELLAGLAETDPDRVAALGPVGDHGDVSGLHLRAFAIALAHQDALADVAAAGPDFDVAGALRTHTKTRLGELGIDSSNPSRNADSPLPDKVNPDDSKPYRRVSPDGEPEFARFADAPSLFWRANGDDHVVIGANAWSTARSMLYVGDLNEPADAYVYVVQVPSKKAGDVLTIADGDVIAHGCIPAGAREVDWRSGRPTQVSDPIHRDEHFGAAPAGYEHAVVVSTRPREDLANGDTFTARHWYLDYHELPKPPGAEYVDPEYANHDNENPDLRYRALGLLKTVMDLSDRFGSKKDPGIYPNKNVLDNSRRVDIPMTDAAEGREDAVMGHEHWQTFAKLASGGPEAYWKRSRIGAMDPSLVTGKTRIRKRLVGLPYGTKNLSGNQAGYTKHSALDVSPTLAQDEKLLHEIYNMPEEQRADFIPCLSGLEPAAYGRVKTKDGVTLSVSQYIARLKLKYPDLHLEGGEVNPWAKEVMFALRGRPRRRFWRPVGYGETGMDGRRPASINLMNGIRDAGLHTTVHWDAGDNEFGSDAHPIRSPSGVHHMSEAIKMFMRVGAYDLTGYDLDNPDFVLTDADVRAIINDPARRQIPVPVTWAHFFGLGNWGEQFKLHMEFVQWVSTHPLLGHVGMDASWAPAQADFFSDPKAAAELIAMGIGGQGGDTLNIQTHAQMVAPWYGPEHQAMLRELHKIDIEAFNRYAGGYFADIHENTKPAQDWFTYRMAHSDDPVLQQHIQEMTDVERNRLDAWVANYELMHPGVTPDGPPPSDVYSGNDIARGKLWVPPGANTGHRFAQPAESLPRSLQLQSSSLDLALLAMRLEKGRSVSPVDVAKASGQDRTGSLVASKYGVDEADPPAAVNAPAKSSAAGPDPVTQTGAQNVANVGTYLEQARAKAQEWFNGPALSRADLERIAEQQAANGGLVFTEGAMQQGLQAANIGKTRGQQLCEMSVRTLIDRRQADNEAFKNARNTKRNVMIAATSMVGAAASWVAMTALAAAGVHNEMIIPAASTVALLLRAVYSTGRVGSTQLNRKAVEFTLEQILSNSSVFKLQSQRFKHAVTASGAINSARLEGPTGTKTVFGRAGADMDFLRNITVNWMVGESGQMRQMKIAGATANTIAKSDQAAGGAVASFELTNPMTYPGAVASLLTSAAYSASVLSSLHGIGQDPLTHLYGFPLIFGNGLFAGYQLLAGSSGLFGKNLAEAQGVREFMNYGAWPSIAIGNLMLAGQSVYNLATGTGSILADAVLTVGAAVTGAASTKIAWTAVGAESDWWSARKVVPIRVKTASILAKGADLMGVKNAAQSKLVKKVGVKDNNPVYAEGLGAPRSIPKATLLAAAGLATLSLGTWLAAQNQPKKHPPQRPATGPGNAPSTTPTNSPGSSVSASPSATPTPSASASPSATPSPSTTPAPGSSTPPTPSASPTTVTVKRGDTLAGIFDEYESTIVKEIDTSGMDAVQKDERAWKRFELLNPEFDFSSLDGGTPEPGATGDPNLIYVGDVIRIG